MTHRIHHKLRILKKRHHHTIKEVGMVASAVFLFLSALFLFWISTFQIPDLHSFEERKVTESTKIYDRTGTIVLYDVFENTKRTIVPFEKISRYVKNATVAIEDAEFYQHHGIKITSIIRAILANLGAGGYSQGGSTITQQVVKNSILTNEKLISRKLKEWVLSLKLERIMTKDEILGLYLNEAPYGGNVYGVQEASSEFFGKPASDLTLAESAYLAALPQAPTRYSPYGPHLDELTTRKNLVLKRMLENKFITDKEYKDALAEKVEFQPEGDTNLKAAHFVMYVKEYLEKKYGKQAVEQDGLKVITTLNYDLQQKAEKLAFEYALKNKDTFNAENIALVAIDPTNGDILTMVGSRDYFDKEIDGNFNVATAYRQPGSTFKPFAYVTAFEKGYTPSTVLFDLRTEFQASCNPDGNTPTTTPTGAPIDNGCYTPENYDHIYRGPITMREALAQSINVPAIKTLYLAGVTDSLKTAKDMGISSLKDANQYGLTLVLGGGEVSLLEMTSAYGVFSQGGVRNASHAILRVEDKSGKILEQSEPNPVQVIPEQNALQISSVLSDESARVPAFGSHSFLYVPGHTVAVKTGTTNDYRDAWIIGYTPHFVAGAWAGNNDNRPMEKKVAGFIIAPFWNAFMRSALENVADEPFKKPDQEDPHTLKPVFRGMWQGGQVYTIDQASNKLATEYTPNELKKDMVVQNVHSILYWVDRNNPRGPAPEHPENDSQFANWEYPVRKWAEEHGLIDQNPTLVIPTATDDVHVAGSLPQITLVSPSSNRHYQKDSPLSVAVRYNGKYPLLRADISVNGLYVGSTSNTNFSFIPSDLETLNTENTLSVVIYDSVLNRVETTTTFIVD
jgi:1A family penicillin-binding protein